MRCPQCGFENMPGRQACLRCSAVLQEEGLDIDVHPPRASRWRKSLRRVLRALGVSTAAREFRDTGRAAQSRLDAWGASLGDLFYLWLSIIPGLGHFARGRFKRARWYVLAWVVSMAAAVFLWGSSAGYFMIGLCVVLHAWIAIDGAQLFSTPAMLARRIGAFLAVALILIFVYVSFRRVALGHFQCGYTALDVPWQDVREGDVLLVRQDLVDGDELGRGALVLARLYGRSTPMVGQLIGFPGEEVVIREGVFVVNGNPLEPDQYPVPRWLRGHNVSMTVPAGSRFVTSEFNLRVLRAQVNVQPYIREACLVQEEALLGRAIMRWFPLGRRGFLKEMP